MAGYCTSVRPYFHEPQASENTAHSDCGRILFMKGQLKKLLTAAYAKVATDTDVYGVRESFLTSSSVHFWVSLLAGALFPLVPLPLPFLLPGRLFERFRSKTWP